MSRLNRKYLVSEYSYYKKRAFKQYQNNEIKNCIDSVKYCSNIAWRFPILFNYVDDELEGLLEKVSNAIIKDEYTNYPTEKNKNRIVFYAGQLVDLGALTEQYLNFFIENKFEILLIVLDIENTIYAPKSFKLLQTCPNVKVYIPESKDKLLKIESIYAHIKDFNPGMAFLHFMPDDVVGYTVFSKIKTIKKYYIVHNDHTFWLGKGCSDYFIEFRKFGYQVATQRRNIPYSKMVLLPYYPINNDTPFAGLPFDRTGKVIGISGALSMYKYLMDPELKYFKAIKEVLKRNTNFVFCLCGSGVTDEIKAIFQGDAIEERVYYLGKRNDFYSLVGQCDILFESYPLKGGLTILFGTEQKKAIVGVGNYRNASGCIQDWFDFKEYKEPLTMEEFIMQADLLIKDEEYRKKNTEMFAANRFNKIDFDKGLWNVIEEKYEFKQLYVGESLPLDDEYFLNEYLSLSSKIEFLRIRISILKGNLTVREWITFFYTLLTQGGIADFRKEFNFERVSNAFKHFMSYMMKERYVL